MRVTAFVFTALAIGLVGGYSLSKVTTKPLTETDRVGPSSSYYEIPGSPIGNYSYREREPNLEIYSASEIHKIFAKGEDSRLVGKKIRVTGTVLESSQSSNEYTVGFLTSDHWPLRSKDRSPDSAFYTSVGPSVVAMIGSKRSQARRIRKFDYVEIVGIVEPKQSNNLNYDSLSIQIKNGVVERHSSMFGHMPDE